MGHESGSGQSAPPSLAPTHVKAAAKTATSPLACEEEKLQARVEEPKAKIARKGAVKVNSAVSASHGIGLKRMSAFRSGREAAGDPRSSRRDGRGAARPPNAAV